VTIRSAVVDLSALPEVRVHGTWVRDVLSLPPFVHATFASLPEARHSFPRLFYLVSVTE